MMAALPGRVEEYQQDKEGRWFHPDHDGLITLRDGLSFKDYFAKRAEPQPEPIDKLADLESRFTKLEAEVAALLAATPTIPRTKP